MSSSSLESAVREITSVDPEDRRKVSFAVKRIAAAIDEQVAERVRVSVAEAVREMAVEARLDSGAAAADTGAGRARRKLGGSLAQAMEGGESFRNAVWARAEMLSSDAAAKRLNMSREALNKRRQAGKVLGLEASKRGIRYPKWQFEDRVLPSVPDVLAALPHLDPWGHYLFFSRREPLLGATPLEALRRGQSHEVLRVARLLAAEATG